MALGSLQHSESSGLTHEKEESDQTRKEGNVSEPDTKGSGVSDHRNTTSDTVLPKEIQIHM